MPKISAAQHRIRDASAVLVSLGFEGRQTSELACRTLLALTGVTVRGSWADATCEPMTIRAIIDFIGEHYPPRPAENTRETVRDEVVKHFVSHGLLVRNADDPNRPTNSSKTNYRLTPLALAACRTYATREFSKSVVAFRNGAVAARAEMNRVRDLAMIPVVTEQGEVKLSPGGQSPLIKSIIEDFGSRFAPGATLLYVGDTAAKFAFFDKDTFASLGLVFDPSEKMPDVVLLCRKRGWLILVEAVASDGAVDGKRRMELKRIFGKFPTGLVFVTAFANRATMRTHLADLAWETEVWLASDPDHMIHLNGERFLGPYDDTKSAK